MAVGRTIRWMLIITLLVIVAICLGGYWAWLRGDDLIRDGILNRFATMAPDWNLGLQSVRFDGDRRLHLKTVSLTPRGATGHLIEVPEAVVTIDREQFLRSQQLIIQRVRLIRPTLTLHRHTDGSWNWQQFPKMSESNSVSPDIQLDDATVYLSLDQANNLPTVRLKLANTSLQVIPSAHKVFDVVGRSRINDEATMSLDGWANIQNNTWRIRGKMDRLAADSDLLQLAASSSSRFQNRMNDFGGGLNAGTGPFASTETTGSMLSPLQPASATIPGLGIDGTLNILFDAGSPGVGQPTDFQMKVDVTEGRIDNPAVPFLLRDVRGTLIWKNQQLQLSDVQATHGDTQLALDAALSVGESQTPVNSVTPSETPVNRVSFSMTDLKLDQRLRESLPPLMQRTYDKLRPAGVVDVRGELVKDSDGRWQTANVVADLKGCSANPIQFQYPVHAAFGQIRQRGEKNEFDLSIEAKASEQVVKVTGLLRNPGPKAETRINIAVNNVLIDRTFHDALDEKGRRVLEALQVTGLADVRVTLLRPPGPGKKTEPVINAKIRHGKIKLRTFPYPVSEITGFVKYNPANRRWTFDDLQGFNGKTVISAEGWFDRGPDGSPKPGQLKLGLAAQDAHFDDALKAAVNPGLRQVWDELRPSGTFNMEAVLDWLAVSNGPVDLTVQKLNVSDGSLFLRSFPYRLTQVQGQVKYSADNNRLAKVTFSEFTGTHDSTIVQGQGSFDELPDGGWNLHLEKVRATKVRSDAALLRAVPAGVRSVLEQLNPTAPFLIEDAEIDLLQRSKTGLVTAAWDLKTRLLGGKVTAGLDFENISGVVTSKGTWNGRDLVNNGQIRLASVDVLNHRLTEVNGPYSADNNSVIAGSAQALGTDRNRIPLSQRFTAKTYDGQLTFDAVVPLDDTPWRMLAILKNSRLETYARSKFPGQRNIRGVVNGWISLTGRGDVDTSVTGRGEVQVSPAALYEVPVILQMFDALSKFNFGPPEQVAFDYAKTRFDVARGQFLFNPIDLVGNAMSLRGKGSVGFDGRLALDFFFHDSRKPQLFSALMKEATRGWVGVYVRGNLDNPRTEVRTGVPVNEALNNFLRVLNQPPQAPLQLNIPNLFPVVPAR